MKPVPFAQFLARQQQSASPAAAEPVAWPPSAKKADPAEKPRVSPLLRRAEAEKAEPTPVSSQRIEQGRLQAFEDGREAARKELEADRARMREALAVEVANERKKWAEEEGERLANAHRAAFDAFGTRCAQAVANILRPFLTTLAIGRVTEALVENLEALFASRSQSVFEIAGPAELLDALREKFADRDASILYKPNNAIDIRVCVDDTIIETQLGAWMTALGALPGDRPRDDRRDLADELGR